MIRSGIQPNPPSELGSGMIAPNPLWRCFGAKPQTPAPDARRLGTCPVVRLVSVPAVTESSPAPKPLDVSLICGRVIHVFCSSRMPASRLRWQATALRVSSNWLRASLRSRTRRSRCHFFNSAKTRSIWRRTRPFTSWFFPDGRRIRSAWPRAACPENPRRHEN